MTILVRRRLPAALGVLALLGAGLLVTAPPSSGTVAAEMVLEYSFDEVSSKYVSDQSGRGHTLRLTGNWEPVVTEEGTLGVDFQPLSMGATPSARKLNPGWARFAVTVVLQVSGEPSSADTPNIVQKGKFADAGQFKMQLKLKHGGRIQCRFAGLDLTGQPVVRMVTSRTSGIADGAWHVATCWRDKTELGVTVDGVTRSVAKVVGSITNERDLRLANKNVTSLGDQLPATIHYVGMALGDGARELTISRATVPAGPEPQG